MTAGVVLVCVLSLLAGAQSRRPTHASLSDAAQSLMSASHHNRQPMKETPDTKDDNKSYWSVIKTPDGEWSVAQGVLDGYAAVGSFEDGLNVTGWGVLEVWASSRVNDSDQSYATGFLEGYVTAHHIYPTFRNVLAQTFGLNATAPPDAILEFLSEQEDFAMQQIASNPGDSYWMHLANVFSQYEGLEAGYQHAADENPDLHPALPHWAFQIMNGAGDLLDIIPAVIPQSQINWKSMSRLDAEDLHASLGKCSVLIKPTGNYSDLFVSHSTWFPYSNLNRIFKTYHMSFQNPATAAQTVSFSSYPGFLESYDDYYMMSSGLSMVQTTNTVMNNSAFALIKPQSLLAWQRVRVASAMAHSGQEWFDVFRRHFSGTYANQYMLVDLKLFKPYTPLPSNLLWVVEEMAGMILGHEQTAALRRGYWASYNIPYYKRIYEASGYVEMAQLHGNYFTYELCPRAQIFRRDQGSVTDLASLKTLMRSNNYMTDPYAYDGTAQNPTYAICSRGDLKTVPKAGGCYDTKVTSHSLGPLVAHIISGPTTNLHSLPVFSWATSPFSAMAHFGLPMSYDFDWITVAPSNAPTFAQ